MNGDRVYLRHILDAIAQAFVDRGGGSQRLGQAILTQADLMFEWWYTVRDGTTSRGTGRGGGCRRRACICSPVMHATSGFVKAVHSAYNEGSTVVSPMG